MACSSGDGLRSTGDYCINPALLCVPTGDPTLETTVARVQLPVVPQQPQLSAYEVSTTRFIMI
jgi:hypothetical protein